jgi:steroid delta-isomerase-like uncharacterized protein
VSEENKAVVRAFIERAYNAGDLGAVDELVGTMHVHHDRSRAGLPPGREGVKAFVAMYRTAFPDLEVTIDDIVAEDDRVVTRWTARGTHTGPLAGLMPTGNRIAVEGMAIDRLDGGVMVESWSSFDALGLMQQLGFAPAATG